MSLSESVNVKDIADQLFVSNYACDPNSPHLCISTPPPGDIIAVTDGISCSSGTAASASPTALSAEAIRILLVKSSDPTAASDGTSTNDLSSKKSFGNGAKIAIGIVIPVVALLIGAAALYFLRRRKRLQKQTSDQEVLSEGDRSDLGLKAELPGSIAAAISGSKGVVYQKPELDKTVIAILPELATDPPRDEIQELHGNTLTVKPTDAIAPASKPHDLIGHSVVREDEQNPVGTLSGTNLGNPSELGLWNWSNFDTQIGSNESYEHRATNGHQ